MLQRYANVFNSLFLLWDVICLELAWSTARSYQLNLARPASLFKGWYVHSLGAIWLASAWLFPVHNHQAWSRRHDRIRNHIAAVSCFVGLARIPHEQGARS